jgi:hypothetical protein
MQHVSQLRNFCLDLLCDGFQTHVFPHSPVANGQDSTHRQASESVGPENGQMKGLVCAASSTTGESSVHTNTVESAFSLPKRGIMGTWHRVSAKHLLAYLDEMTWRFNNRKNPFLFRDTMLKLIHSENLEYKELTKAA